MAIKKSDGYTIGSIYEDLMLTSSTNENHRIISAFPFILYGGKTVHLFPYSNVNGLTFNANTRVWLLKDTDDGEAKEYLVFIEIESSSFTSKTLSVTEDENNYFNSCFTTSNGITTVSTLTKTDFYWRFCRWCRDNSTNDNKYSIVKFILVDVSDLCTGTATDRTAINVNNLVTPTLTSTSLSFSTVDFDRIEETESYFCYKNYTAANDYYCYKSLPSTEVYDIYINNRATITDPYPMEEYTLKKMGAKALNVTLYNAESADETASHITVDFTKKIVTDEWPLTISLCSNPSTGESIKIIRNTNSNEFSFSGFSAIDSTKVADGIHYQPENQKLKRKYWIESRSTGNPLLGDFFSENTNLLGTSETGTFPSTTWTPYGAKIDVHSYEGLFSGTTQYTSVDTIFFTDIISRVGSQVIKVDINGHTIDINANITYRNLKYTYDFDNVYYYDTQSSPTVKLHVWAKVGGGDPKEYGFIPLKSEHCTGTLSGITIGEDREVVGATGVSYVNVFGTTVTQPEFNGYVFTKSDESESGNFSSFTDNSTTINVFNVTGSNDHIAIRNGNLYVKGSNSVYGANHTSIIYEKYGQTEWLPQIVDLRAADIRKTISGSLSLDKFSSALAFDALKALNFFDKMSILECTDRGVTLATGTKDNNYTQTLSTKMTTGSSNTFFSSTSVGISTDIGVRLSDHIGIGYISTKSFNNGSVPRLTSADGSSRYLKFPTVDGNIVSATLYYNNGNFVFASTSHELIDTGRVVKYQITHNSLPSGSSYVQTALTTSEAQYKVVDFDKTANKFVLTSNSGNVELQCTLGANGAVTISSGTLSYTSSRFKGFAMNQNGISPESSSWVILPESFTYEFNDNLSTTNYIVCDALTREILTDMTHVVPTTNVFLGQIL